MKTYLDKLEKAREILRRKTLVCFSMDVDWASEYAIAQAVQLFRERDLPVTVFLTHKSAVIDELRAAHAIHCGIHPNFMPDSSQGRTYQEIIDFCFDLLPDARLCRSHRYYEVNDTTELLEKRGIVCESNICTLMETLPPFLHRSKVVSFPIFWEDGAYLYWYAKFDYDDFLRRLSAPGLKVINMHPMHLMLNTPYFSYTREIKDRLSREEWNRLSREEIEKIAWKGDGIAAFSLRILDDVKKAGFETAYMDDIYDWIMSL